MILCHKCAGTFEQHPFLEGCRCISGYPRGFEPNLTEQQALEEQIKAREHDLIGFRR